jgi:hypothetical protein
MVTRPTGEMPVSPDGRVTIPRMSDQTAKQGQGKRNLLMGCAGVGVVGSVLVLLGPAMLGILLLGGAASTAALMSRGGSEIRRSNMTRLGVLLILLTIDAVLAVVILGNGHGSDPATITARNAWSTRGSHPVFVAWAWANLVVLALLAMSFVSSSTGFQLRRGRRG